MKESTAVAEETVKKPIFKKIMNNKFLGTLFVNLIIALIVGIVFEQSVKDSRVPPMEVFLSTFIAFAIGGCIAGVISYMIPSKKKWIYIPTSTFIVLTFFYFFGSN